MSGYDNYSEIFDGDGREEQTGGALRRQLEETLAANKKLTERLDRLENRDTLEGLFKEKGIDPAASSLVPTGTDPKEWLEQNARFLKGVEVREEQKQEEQLSPEEQQAKEDQKAQLEQEQRQMEDIQKAGDSGIPSTATTDQLQKIQSFDNEADLMAYIQSGGAV